MSLSERGNLWLMARLFVKFLREDGRGETILTAPNGAAKRALATIAKLPTVMFRVENFK